MDGYWSRPTTKKWPPIGPGLGTLSLLLDHTSGLDSQKIAPTVYEIHSREMFIHGLNFYCDVFLLGVTFCSETMLPVNCE